MSTVGQGAGYLVGAIAGSFIPGVGTIMGAQIGGMIGGYLDPPKQKGNKPQTDLSVQTATYGAPIGTGYGNYAKYGNLFWVEGNKLRLETGSSGGGKGGQKKATPDEIYGTFAIGFGEGEIAAFGRIWCNGKLVYDPTSGTLGAKMANGDVAGNLTFYTGSATQLPDPRMQADMGATHTPAYRGLHYIVFNDWPMADYGNTLMGVQVKAEIINSATVVQYVRHFYVDNVIPDTTTYPGAAATEYGYFNPRFSGGVFMCDKSSAVNGYAFTYGISSEGVVLWRQAGGAVTGEFGYIGQIDAGSVIYVGGYTGVFEIAGATFKTKTADANNTCHGMAVGADGRLYSLERVSGAWLFNIYDGSTLDLISSGTNNPIRLGDIHISLPCIPGTNVSFCVESDGTHVWTAQEGGGNSNFYACEISTSGNLDIVHSYNTSYGTPGDESYLGASARFAAIVADNGICYGINNHGGFFVYDRIKSLTKTSVTLASIIQKRCLLSGLLSSGDIDTSAITQMVRGYKVDNVGSIRNSLEPLQGAWPLDIIPSGYQIKFKPRGASPLATIDIADLGAVSGNEKIGDILTQSREMDTQLPVKVQITYIDVNREYDKGTGPGAWRTNTDAVNVQAIDMPIVLNADEAAGIEETLLYMYWMERAEFSFTLPPVWLALEVADVITVNEPGASYELRLTDISYLPDGRMECSAKLNNPAIYTWTANGQEGQSTGQVLTYPGGTLISLLDLPCVDSTTMNTPGFVAAIDGYMTTWPGGTVFRSSDNGTTWAALSSQTAPGSMLGSIVSPPSSGRTDSIDSANQLTVRFFSTANLSILTWPEFYAGGNHFAIGANGRWEIIGAKTAVENADGTWTLSDLMRGRFGTEHNRASHLSGDTIVLLDRSRIEFIGMSTADFNVSRLYAGVTLRQELNPALAESFAYSGENLECRAPSQIKGSKNAGGDWGIEWMRGTRLPVGTFSGMPTPLGESSEAYEVEIWDAGWATLKRTITGLTSAFAQYTNAQQVTDFGSVQKLLYVKVYQLSASVGRGYAGQAVCGNLELLKVKSLIHFDDSPVDISRVLGLHCDGANGSTTFTDVTGKTVSVYNGAQISTSQYPSLTGKTSSAYFDGVNDYAVVSSYSDFNFGSSNFTIRFWYLPVSQSAYSAIMSGDEPDYPLTIYHGSSINSGNPLVAVGPSGSAWFSNASAITLGPVSNGTFYHIEIVRSGDTFYAFKDGMLIATGSTDSAAQNVGNIGSFTFGRNSAYYLSCYLSEIEVYRGIALHTANFAPPSSPFTAAAPLITDQAQNEITIVGSAVTVYDSSAFGGTCLQANQSTGYLTTPVIPLTDDYWTIDLWINPVSLPSSGNVSGIFDYGTTIDGTGGLCAVIRGDGLPMCFVEYGLEINATVTVAAGERAHIFIQRSGSKIYMGAKGIVGTNLDIHALYAGDKGFRIGYANASNFDGKEIKIDEFRVFAGEAKYPLSGNYIVPTTPFPDL